MGTTPSKSSPQNGRSPLLRKPAPTLKDLENEHSWRAENLQNRFELGRGPNGYVVEAFHTLTNEPCAIKSFEYNTRDDPSYQYAIEKARKAYKANKLCNPNIVTTYVCQAIEVKNNFSIKNKFAVVMELFKQNLADLIVSMKAAEQIFSEQQITKFAFDLASALTSAHRQQLYHTNIKDENIFITPYNLKLGDFDIPYALGRNISPKTATYLAPELEKVEEDVDWGKADCFALGIVLAKACLLRETLTSQERRDIPALIEEIAVNYSQRIAIIIKRLTTRDPAERWTADKLFKSLQEIYMLDELNEEEFRYLLSDEQIDVRKLIEKGASYRRSEDPRAALSHFENAKDILMEGTALNQYDRTLLATCLHNCALCYYDLKEYGNSLNNHLRCLDLKRKHLGGLDVWTTYGNIGKVYMKLGDAQKGLMYYIKSYNVMKDSQSDSRQLNLAKSLDNIASAYESLGDYQNALHNHVLCLEIVKKQFGETNSRYGKSLRNVSRMLKNLDMVEEAKEYEVKARKINY